MVTIFKELSAETEVQYLVTVQKSPVNLGNLNTTRKRFWGHDRHFAGHQGSDEVTK